ncbi:MAG: hypothetical protein P1V81_07400 [Planctomycetota bacterium]|nr:hypothetical protein [Planctomycetota bacterium]
MKVPFKLGTEYVDDGPVIWNNVFRREETVGPLRLAIAPREDPLGLMCELAESIGPDYYLLYVHAVERSGSPEGRYESSLMELVDVRIFFAEFEEMLVNDGRHELWIGTDDDSGMLVYDEHGILYAYGPIEDFVRTLAGRGFVEGDFSVPEPHSHHYHAVYDEDVERLIAHWDWHRTDLQPEDER